MDFTSWYREYQYVIPFWYFSTNAYIDRIPTVEKDMRIGWMGLNSDLIKAQADVQRAGSLLSWKKWGGQSYLHHSHPSDAHTEVKME